MSDPAPVSASAAQNLHRRMWRLAGPAILANLSVPLLGAVDTAVIGHLPSPVYLGAIAVGSIIFSFLYWGFGFLRMGTTGLSAQMYGELEVDPDAARPLGLVFARSMVLALGLAALILLLQIPTSWIALYLIGPSEEVTGLAQQYFDIRVWSAPATLTQYAVLGWLFGTQRAGSALAVQLVMNLLNVALDLLFVLGFGMGVSGVALGTVLAEYVGVLFGVSLIIFYLRRSHGISFLALFRDRELFLPSAIKKLLDVNSNLFLRTMLLLTAIGILTSTGARLGDVTLAANAILWNFLMFLSFGLDGFAHAAEAMVGSDVGARNRQRFLASVRVTSAWALGTSLLYSLVYLAFGSDIIALLTGIAEVRSYTEEFLPWMIALPLISVWSFQLDGIFIGTTRTREMRRSMFWALLVYIPCVAITVPYWGNHGLWFSFTFFMIIRAVALGLSLPSLMKKL